MTLYPSRPDPRRHSRGERVCRLPRRWRYMGAPPSMHELRLRRVLRLVSQQACICARTGDGSSDRGIVRAGRGLVLVLRR